MSEATTEPKAGSRTSGLTDCQSKYFAHELQRSYANDHVGKLAGLLFDAQVEPKSPPRARPNPQRVEQRIGRVHRLGQKHNVVVVNFSNKGSS